MKTTEQKTLNKILFWSSIMIVVASLNVLMLAKSKEFFEALQAAQATDHQNYINSVLVLYFSRIIDPIMISIYSLFSYRKYGFNKLFKLIFAGLLLARFVRVALSLEIFSVFYFLDLVVNALFFVSIVRIPIKKEGK